METIKLIVLASSRASGGRCVAGVRADTFEWIRLVGGYDFADGMAEHDLVIPPRPGLPVFWTNPADGSHLELLDLIQVEVTWPREVSFQRENAHVGPNRWSLLERPARVAYLGSLADRLIDPDTWSLFDSREISVEYAIVADRPRPTLRLIEPKNITWVLDKRWNKERQARVHFSLGDYVYDLAITDPEVEAILFANGQPESTESDLRMQDRLTRYGHEADSTLAFAISLGTPHNGRCYKLVAGVVVLPSRSTPPPQAVGSPRSLAELCREHHLDFIDAGADGFWILGGPALGQSIQDWAQEGFEFRFLRVGAAATGGQPAWRIGPKKMIR